MSIYTFLPLYVTQGFSNLILLWNYYLVFVSIAVIHPTYS